MIEAIVSDLDGTILPAKDYGKTNAALADNTSRISPKVIEKLNCLQETKKVRIIATGRTLFAVYRVLPTDFPLDYLIFSSGAGIMRWNDKQFIHTNHLTGDDVRKIASYLRKHNINFCIQKEIPDNHHFFYTNIPPLPTDFVKRVDVFKEFGTLITNDTELNLQATQFLLIPDENRLDLLEQICRDLSEYSVIRATSPYNQATTWIEIFPKHVNKGTSLIWLLNELKIDMEQCAGLGNDYNDIDFLDLCGKSYVVGNAPDTLKQRYKTVATDVNCGFCEFVEKIMS
jgi:Cof subfamily protein (haloacid dehalogenase superfamily)